MVKQASYETNLSYAVETSRLILRWIGAWPLPDRASNLERLVQRLLNLLCYFLFLFILIPGLLLMFLKERNARARVKMSGPLLNCLLGMIKYTVLVLHLDKIRSGLREMRLDWEAVKDPHDREVMLSKARIGRGLVLLSATFMYSSGLSFRTIIPLSKGSIVTPQNVTIRPLACPSYFVIFDEQISPAYEIVFVVQFFAGFVVYSVTCGVCGLAAFFVMHVCGQQRVLIKRMRSLVDGQDIDDKLARDRVASIVEHQVKIRGFLERIRKTMEYLCFVEITGCTSLVCVVAYRVIMEWEKSDAAAMLTHFVVMICFFFSIFIFCFIGQLLEDESENVSTTSSSVKWYRLPKKSARCMILIIAISDCPMRITAGKLMPMSLPMFARIFQTSVGFFNILRRLI